MGTVRDGNWPVGIVQDGKCPGWELFGGICPGWELSGGNCPGWKLSGIGIVRDGNSPGIANKDVILTNEGFICYLRSTSASLLV